MAVRCDGENSDLTIEVAGDQGRIPSSGPRHAVEPRQVIDLLVLHGVLEEQGMTIGAEFGRAVFAWRRCNDPRLSTPIGIHPVQVKSNMAEGGIPTLHGGRENDFLPIGTPDSLQDRKST